MQYPNRYYAELGARVIPNPQILLNPGEVCFYQGPARSEHITKTTTKGKTQGGKNH